ncbi:polyphosphate kinase 1 [Candidatus Nitrospira allomarina]|uniref:Polyphosphate kinase n=1 Tax=Candidatus Nitrospira allomarina TaxID=3020900 RepID=A0AA96GCL4_9BACT|nr:polyphosphate kinase 1 [Candidatus Nitrospira allomarina]WNM56553.1 polyphosphate kinase 1 [Candidatus Nitrospira allomarina]
MTHQIKPKAPNQSEVIDNLDDPKLYLNRELSWLEFNKRVLEEAEDPSHPLLERIKFLSIFFNNLDEFFMIRISGLREQLSSGVLEAALDGMSPSDQLGQIRDALLRSFSRVTQCWQDDLLTRLAQAHICILAYQDLKPKQRSLLRRYFRKEIFPALTPLAFDPSHPFPHISNLTVNLAVVANDPERGECFARIKVPSLFPRLIRIPDESQVSDDEQMGLATGAESTNFVWLEDIIAANLDLLFPGLTIQASYYFRITRDADFEIEEDEAGDLLAAIEEQIDLRQFGSVVRLELDRHMPDSIKDILVRNLSLAPYQVYTYDFRLGLSNLLELTAIDRPDLKFSPHFPNILHDPTSKESLFSLIKREDIFLHHPYDSFSPVVDFIRQAALDPKVLAIKQTLYRVGINSPVVDALMEARQNDKQVAVLLELKARFDEENNIEWARKLEDEGVHVVYGVLGLKTHAKVCMVVRRESDGIRRYLHLGTGNYNPITSKFYTDFSLFTCHPVFGEDVTDLFNALTGYSKKDSYAKLLIAPVGIRTNIIERINREISRQQQHGDGYLAFKVNSLVDKASIQALYRASQAGVKIELMVRGMCGLRPGVPGLSQTITVTSLVGRFLEHSRCYYFGNGGQDELFLGSADLMPRNMDRRVEILFPIESPTLRAFIVETVLRPYLKDNMHTRQLQPDGTYTRVKPLEHEAPFHAQDWFIANWKGKYTKPLSF